MHMSFLEAQNIDKSFTGFLALDNVTLNVPKGSVYGLLGPNGAGKTTLLRIINRILFPDTGYVKLNGKDINETSAELIGYLPEERGLYKKMKVGEHALYLARLKGLSRKEALSKLKYWFDKFEISEWWNNRIEELSKGMAQKVQFITTVLHDPELLILDEPFSGLDPVNANRLKQEVLKFKDNGKTIILSTHDMASVEELCDNITLIHKSKTILEGRVSDVKQQYKSNTHEIVFSGQEENFLASLNSGFQTSKVKTLDDGKQSVIISIDENKSGNELLKKALEEVTVHMYREILPSMNDIFIQAINKTQM